LNKANFSVKNQSGPTQYNHAMQFFHWAAGGSILACLGLVQYKQSLPADTDVEKKKVGNLMMLHKSFGLVVTGLYLPRLAAKMVSTHPAAPGFSVVQSLAKINHWGMYALVMTMCATGVGMGYQSGAGVPFFGLATLPGRPDVNKDMAQYTFKLHKYAGVALEFGVAAHVLGFTAHFLTGHNLLRRMAGPVGSAFLVLPWVAVGLGCAFTC